jgi:hypothetical protein
MKNKQTINSLSGIMISLLIFATPALCTTFYVSKDGSDSYTGLLSTYQNGSNGPFKTISKGISALNNNSSDTLYIRSGTYVEKIAISKNGLNADNPITISGYPGEVAVIDGNNSIPNDISSLVNVSGNYVTIKNFQVKNSASMAVRLQGSHNSAIGLYIERSYRQAIIATNDYSLIENCEANYCGIRNEFNSTGPPSIISCARFPDNCTIRGCTVYDSWGEGISSYEATNVVIEDNISYNNKLNFYISDSQDVTFQRNLSYCTDDGNLVRQYVKQQMGLYTSDERCIASTGEKCSRRLTIVNNLIMGCDVNWYSGYAGKNWGLVDSLVAHNTFVSSTNSGWANIKINAAQNHKNSRVQNNIILQQDSINICSAPNDDGITFYSNMWSKKPLSAASGVGDIIADPKLSKIGPTTPGSVTGDFFKILSDSEARDKAAVLNEVSEDYLKNSRGTAPDIGGYEYQESPTRLELYAPTNLKILSGY